MQIFISYKREDHAFVAQLKTALENIGHQVWVDFDDIPAGRKWSDAVQEGLDAAEVMLLVTTPESMASDNVADEWQYFHSRRKPIIPLWLCPSEMPFQLERLQRIDFTSEFDPGLAKLSLELANITDIPPPPVKPNARPQFSPRLFIGLAATIVFIGAIGLLLLSQNSSVNNPSGLMTPTAPVTVGSTRSSEASASPPITSEVPATVTLLAEDTSTTDMVTAAQFAEFLNGRPFPPDRRDNSGNLLLDSDASPLILNSSTQRWESDENTSHETLTYVTWYGANEYCAAQHLGLPSEKDIDISLPSLEWLEDGRIAGRGSIEHAAKTFASAEVGFRCSEK